MLLNNRIWPTRCYRSGRFLSITSTAQLAALLLAVAVAQAKDTGTSEPTHDGTAKAAALGESGGEGNPEAPSAAEIVNDVIKARKEREARFRSGRFVWKERRFLAKGAIHSAGEPDLWGAKGAIPPADVTHEYQRSLLFCGGNVRYAENEPIWSGPANDFRTELRDTVWDGKVARALDTRDGRETFRYQGQVTSSSFRITGMAVIKPIMIHYRPASDPLGYRRLQESTANRAMIGDSPCVVFRRKPNRFGVVRCVWLDPERGYLVRRWLSERDGQILGQTDVFYDYDPVHGWVPRGWKRVQCNVAGKLTRSEEATVLERSLNVDLAPSEFQLEFPAGTLVSDQDVEFPDRQRYFVRQDGTKRLITREERLFPLTPQLLMNTEPGGAIPEEYAALNERLQAIGELEPQQQQGLLSEVEAYCTRDPPLPRGEILARRAMARLEQAGNPERAAEVARRFAEVLAEDRDTFLSWAERIETRARRQRLLGNPIEVTGTTVDGNPFDWASYRGKVVLLNFWFLGCKGCREELPQLKDCYKRYHERGLEIVGISTDRDRQALRKFLKDEQIRWVNVYQEGSTPQPTVKLYGIRVFPTNIVADRKGRVVSLDAHGEELIRLLRQLLEPAE